jgi:predicted RNA-binding Zn-ribbon protein involved in translation (DUF1610 family)
MFDFEPFGLGASVTYPRRCLVCGFPLFLLHGGTFHPCPRCGTPVEIGDWRREVKRHGR